MGHYLLSWRHKGNENGDSIWCQNKSLSPWRHRNANGNIDLRSFVAVSGSGDIRGDMIGLGGLDSDDLGCREECDWATIRFTIHLGCKPAGDRSVYDNFDAAAQPRVSAMAVARGKEV